ncbi:MAG: Ig-like domain-containing protein [Muribaculaceae bacterium]|nr:Ig-like domain-containing protein [Muribaculaceae bacterium]
MHIYSKGYERALLVVGTIALLFILYSCASIGNPSGGPRDEDPPRLMRANPMPESTGFTGRTLYLEFDELVNVKDAFTNVTVSPPQASAPRVSSSGNRVMVEWSDPLLPDTTYTVDFGTAIEDNNEGNPLGNFSISFSTGPTIDSLRISGIVLDAATLEPQQGMLVGVHSAAAPDSALKTLRFERATKTDDRGRFTLRGLKAQPYNLFALGDLNNDYRRDNPAELLAFYPVPITPYSESGIASDTIYNMLTGAVDSVVSRERTVFKPNNILLSVFDEGYKPQYLVKYERPDSARLQFIFNARSAELPILELIGNGYSEKWSITEYSQYKDTVTYWITEPAIASTDTMHLALSYKRTNQQAQLYAGTDTLMLTKPKVKAPAKRKMNKQQLAADSIAREQAKWLKLSVMPTGKIDVFTSMYIESPEPLTRFDVGMMRLEEKVDSTYKPLPMPELIPDKYGKVRSYSFKYPWEYGKTYRLTIDSTAMTGVSGRFNATLAQEFNVKKPEEYASLTLRLIPDTVQGFVEVLTSGDQPVQRARVQNGIVRFPYLAPTDYYARFVARPLPEVHVSDVTFSSSSELLGELDMHPKDVETGAVSAASDNPSEIVLSEDSVQAEDVVDILEFHTGNYEQRIQPDDVYYYPKVLSLKRHDRSEQWDLNAVAVDQQKPSAIKKNKPKIKSVPSKRNKKGTTNSTQTEEDDEYFDVNNNPFDPNSKRRRSQTGVSY